jgi:hypothetical protein
MERSMSGNVFALPGVHLQVAANLNLSEQELVDASGGYVRPADQLRELHRRGFARAWRTHNGKGHVVLERAHYDAVVTGRFNDRPVELPAGAPRVPLPPNRDAVLRRTARPRSGSVR